MILFSVVDSQRARLRLLPRFWCTGRTFSVFFQTPGRIINTRISAKFILHVSGRLRVPSRVGQKNRRSCDQHESPLIRTAFSWGSFWYINEIGRTTGRHRKKIFFWIFRFFQFLKIYTLINESYLLMSHADVIMSHQGIFSSVSSFNQVQTRSIS